MLRAIGFCVALLLAAIASALAYLGAFASVVVKEQSMGPYRFVYRGLEGADPRQVGAITDQVGAALRAAGITRIRPFDLYYPPGAGDPNEIGWEVAEEHAAALTTLDRSYLQRTLPAQPCLVARFRWKHPLSFVVGFFKVDRALKAYREARGYQAAAAYTLNEGQTILYLQPVVR